MIFFDRRRLIYDRATFFSQVATETVVILAYLGAKGEVSAFVASVDFVCILKMHSEDEDDQ